MRLVEEYQGHLVYEVSREVVCIPLVNPKGTFATASPATARAEILKRRGVNLALLPDPQAPSGK